MGRRLGGERKVKVKKRQGRKRKWRKRYEITIEQQIV